MPEIEIICLANSRKRQGRCVAGLRTDGGGWVRPVASGPDGGLSAGQYRLRDGTEPQTLDVIRVGVKGQEPRPHQPENWLIDGRPWELQARPISLETRPLLTASVVQGPNLLGNQLNRVPDNFLSLPAKASLALILPEALSWRIRLNDDFKQQARVVFTLDGVPYDLSLTDPVWEQKLRRLPEGPHNFAASGVAFTDSVLLTVSLSEPWNGYCYKLVAGVIAL